MLAQVQVWWAPAANFRTPIKSSESTQIFLNVVGDIVRKFELRVS